ncbi:VCBS repeat-containing protein [Cyclobacterium jeungdonense]|uniref:VCBS repeat-containing protein n=1 Tax=Cyclobacterium jeungdonense TaxID=708087 RepID=A0ABT8C4A7_9BACT|nr:VCBS repeat-containing protein [Cyclobacterium jeungdonense]MDN3686932.1 VCBS repeat-containing protein [Cyclobacterium jeungdonense]
MYNYYLFKIQLFGLVLFSFSCQEKVEKTLEIKQFTLLTKEITGVDFENTLTEGLNTNILVYEYFYNGGGVAVGDLNGDGFDDVYFSGNMVENRLYLNRGNMEFDDVTQIAGVQTRPGPWKTGVAFADVDGDGLLDIYVCYSGSLPPEKRKNELYINQGVNEQGIPIFKEMAAQFGIDSEATSTQASFFDLDNDGDLDLFLLNHNPKSLPVLDEASTAEILKNTDPAGPQLFRNDSGTFTEITQEAGIQQVALSYGLGAGIADVNDDGWLDIYVSNDYTAPDYLYLNNGDGTFTDVIDDALGHTSHFSMGNDIADINNDGYPDIFTLDMLPEDNKRQKLLMAPDNYEKFEYKLNVGFHHQYMRNMLHINHGNGLFSEVGQLAGVSNTDWSWAALLADFDNDGQKDLYVTNGYFRDYTNQDFLKYMADYLKNNQNGLRRENILELVQSMPSSDLTNYIFKNEDGLFFEKKSEEWGINQQTNSNGAAYSDLDNDGDLDLVVNNINQPAFIYQNNSDSLAKNNHFLKIKLTGNTANTLGVGTKVTLHYQNQLQTLEQMPTRGYQSSVSPILHFGLGEVAQIDSLVVTWPEGMSEKIFDIQSNQTISLMQENAVDRLPVSEESPALFVKIPSPIEHQSPGNTINDFKRQPLLVNPISFSGPVMKQSDLNGDGLDDLFVGGEKGQPGKIYLQQANGSFWIKSNPDLDNDRDFQDTDALLEDFTGDGHADLYVGSGGYGSLLPKDPLLQDRLYVNDGQGNFSRATDLLPKMLTSTGALAAHDINNDGLQDLFVGGRVIPGRYPETPQSYLLLNEGQGKMADKTKDWLPELSSLGLVTDAAWVDLNSDETTELVVVGEWMPISVFEKKGDKFFRSTKNYFEDPQHGWWNTLHVTDVNADGKPDLIVGNHGLNSQVRASAEEPAEMYYKDFDNNGAMDPILSFYIGGEPYPYLTRDELLDQISMMRTRFTDYESYSEAKLENIFSETELENAGYLKATTLETSLFISQGNQLLKKGSLPAEVQFSPVFSIESSDLNKDGHMDLLLGGNIERARLRFGKYDANYGTVLLGNEDGGFRYLPQKSAGLAIKGDVRSLKILNGILLVGINQGPVVAYRLQNQEIEF